MKDSYIVEIFEKLYIKFIYINANTKYYQVYKEPFKVMYNKDRDFTSDIVNNIIYYFIEHYIKEADIIIKDSKIVLSKTVYNKFYDYLYTLGLDVQIYNKNYKPSKTEYLIKHVISTFIIEKNANLSQCIHSFENLYSKGIKNYSIDIVNYFILISSRQWKGFCDYLNEFMDFYETLDTEYARSKIINMRLDEVENLVNEFYSIDIETQPQKVQKSYHNMWFKLYGGKASKYLEKTDNALIRFYFVNKHYKCWKTKYNYEKEWKDYIKTLQIN